MLIPALLAVVLVGSVLTAGHALLHKRDPRSGLGWIAVCLTLPGLGAMLYWLLGVNRIRTRARRYHDKPRRSKHLAIASSRSTSTPEGVPDSYDALLRTSSAVTAQPLVGGNRVQALYGGEQAYPRMLDAIADASRCVNLCSYLFDGDGSGQRFVVALAAAVERGVDVRVLVDGFGQLVARPGIVRMLRRAGIPHAEFLPISPLTSRLHFNLRNHRKLLLVDHRLGFTGGMNISDRHLSDDLDNPRRVRDVHFEIEGPVVSQMEQTFDHDWSFTVGRQVEPAPPDHCRDAGPALCRGISAGPDEDLGRLLWILIGACHAARSRLRIMTPYFVPGRTLMATIGAAALRDVTTEVILPAESDHPVVGWATQAMLWELLQLGVRVYYQPPPFDHSKLLLVDEHYALIGSANLDPRSQQLNFELNLEVYDPALNRELSSHFEAIRQRSRRITLDEVDSRPLAIRLRDAAARLLSPYL